MTLSKSQSAKVKRALDHHDRYRTAYFWTPPSSAHQRRSMERKDSIDLSFKHDGKKYRYVCVVDVSCKNVYYDGVFSVDGEKKTVRAFKELT